MKRFIIPVFLFCSAAFAANEGANADTLWDEVSVKSGETLSQLCESWELPQSTNFISAFKGIRSQSLRQGEKVRLHRTLGPISRLAYVEFPVNQRISLELKFKADKWTAAEITKDFTERTRTFAGTVDSTLWGSAQKAGMDSQLLIRLSEVFAWVIDFSREVQTGDEWRLVATEYVEGDVHRGWKDIQAVEFKRGTQIYQAFNYEDTETKRKGFFTALGESLEKLFLKSPIKFGHVTSRFSMKRFHPILKYNRPHLGVDYGAPIGTPVMAVGDGTVEIASFSGGGGRVVKIHHNSTYSTAYKHLSRFAAGIHPGKKVRQGDIVGYVGSSGLSTGPHLHFEFLRNGTFVDPQGLKFPAATPLAATSKAHFQESVRTLSALLPNWPKENTIAVRSLSSVNQ